MYSKSKQESLSQELKKKKAEAFIVPLSPILSKAIKKYMYKSSPTNPFYKFYVVSWDFKDSNYISMNQTGFEYYFFPLKELILI